MMADPEVPCLHRPGRRTPSGISSKPANRNRATDAVFANATALAVYPASEKNNGVRPSQAAPLNCSISKPARASRWPNRAECLKTRSGSSAISA